MTAIRQSISDGYQGVVGYTRAGTLMVEKGLNALFSQKYNPLYYHGALPNFFLWVLFITGLLLFAYYNPTLNNAYNSVAFITYQIPSGALFRAMHRYAADGMMIFVLLHVFRVWFTDRYREYRILPWITGVILLVILYLAGLTGYMLIWDGSSMVLSNLTINFLKAFPLIGPSLAGLLLIDGKIMDATLTRYLFLHLAIPASMLFFLWWHYLRITRPVTNAPLVLNLLLFGGLLVACGMFPVSLGEMGTLANPGNTIELDWLYMIPQGILATGQSVALAWSVLLLIPIALLVLPYVQKKQFRGQYAQVLDENCTGCSLCYHDCPYEAIEMKDRDDDTRFKRIAEVNPERCANCGLCVGACAFKAIEIPRMTTPLVLDEIKLALAGSTPT